MIVDGSMRNWLDRNRLIANDLGIQEWTAQMLHIGLMMKNTLTTLLVAIALSACGAMPVNETDKEEIREGRKALLETNNRELSDFLSIIPIFVDMMGGRPNEVNIIMIDGKEIGEEWHRAN
jgi:hypothetical protein